MKPLAFSKSGKFWRGNLHTHSNCSDGLLSPDDLCQRYKDEGYNFLVISDHFVGLYNYPVTEPSDLIELISTGSPGFETVRTPSLRTTTRLA